MASRIAYQGARLLNVVHAAVMACIGQAKPWILFWALTTINAACAVSCIRLFRELGNFKAAVAICTHLNDFAAAAETCEEEAHMLAAREPARAEQKLQEAIRHHKKAKEHLQGFQLLQRRPTLFKNMPPEVSACCCIVA